MSLVTCLALIVQYMPNPKNKLRCHGPYNLKKKNQRIWCDVGTPLLQSELDQQVQANESMQVALAQSSEGKTMTAAELQDMISRHASEMEELREYSEKKISNLSQELSRAREALDVDKEILQDKIDDLQEHSHEQCRKLLESYARIEELEREVAMTQKENLDQARALREEVLNLQKVLTDMEASSASEEAKRAETDAQENTRQKIALEDQVHALPPFSIFLHMIRFF